MEYIYFSILFYNLIFRLFFLIINFIIYVNGSVAYKSNIYFSNIKYIYIDINKSLF